MHREWNGGEMTEKELAELMINYHMKQTSICVDRAMRFTEEGRDHAKLAAQWSKELNRSNKPQLKLVTDETEHD